MSIQAITGNDTLSLFDRVIVDFADGDNSTITFPNELATIKTGKNQNTIYVKNETGNNADLVLRLVRGSADDKFLQAKLATLKQDFASVVLGTGEFVKRLGDGLGNVTRDVYTLTGGIFTKPVDVKENVEGDTEQAVAVYTMRFAMANRGIA